MHVIVFVTDDGTSPDGTAPLLYLRDNPKSALPPRPGALGWRYFATVSLEDQMFESERVAVETALGAGQPFITERMVR